MRLLLVAGTVLFSLGCADRGPSNGATPQVVVVGDPDAREPRFAFTAPAGFEWNEEHSIWYNKQVRTSISLAHAPGTSFQTVIDDFAADRMLSSDMELLDKGIRDIEGRPTLLVHAKRLKAKYPQTACTVAFGTESGCAQITAIYPTDLDEDEKSQIESALLNSRYENPK